MTYHDLIAHFGSLTKASQALGIPIGTIAGWEKGIPPGRQYEIHVRTAGVLQVDTDLRQPVRATPQTAP